MTLIITRGGITLTSGRSSSWFPGCMISSRAFYLQAVSSSVDGGGACSHLVQTEGGSAKGTRRRPSQACRVCWAPVGLMFSFPLTDKGWVVTCRLC